MRKSNSSTSPSKIDVLTLVDLFSGVGGFAAGFIDCLYNGRRIYCAKLLVDIDSEAAYTFRRNFPEIPFLVRDIRKLSKVEILETAGLNSAPDVVIGGPPCQGFSAVGKRALDDKRNELVKDFLRLTFALEPKAVLMENVSQLLATPHKKLADELLTLMQDNGYIPCSGVLNAVDFGVPQMRRRAFILAIRESKTPHESIPFLMRPDDVTHVSVEDAIGDLPPLKAGESKDPAMYTMPPQTDYQANSRQGSIVLFNHVSRNHTEQFLKKISIIPEGGGNRSLPPELKFSDNYYSQAYARLKRDKPAYTITASFANPGSGRFMHYRDLRSISVREAARLQSFDDKFIFYGTMAAQARHIGNAVPPLLARYWANHMASILLEPERETSRGTALRHGRNRRLATA